MCHLEELSKGKENTEIDGLGRLWSLHQRKSSKQIMETCTRNDRGTADPALGSSESLPDL